MARNAASTQLEGAAEESCCSVSGDKREGLGFMGNGIEV